MKLRHTFLCSLALASFTGGCSSPTNDSPPGTTAPPVDIPITIEWSACKVLDVDAKERSAECSTVELRARRDDLASEETFPVHVTRVRTKAKNPSQLWLLNGGPGADGTSLGPYADAIVSQDWPFDVYLVDHRGTGQSNILSCKSTDMAACGKELATALGETLNAISTTESAHDVLDLMKNTREEGQKAYLLGMSYGTYWAHRVLQIAPEAFDGTILDGVCLGEKCRADHVGENHNEGLRHIMEACGKHKLCASKLGVDPMKKLQEVGSALEKKCGLDRETRSTLLFGFGARDAAALPAIVYRLQRCNASDEAVIAHVISTISDPGSIDAAPGEKLAKTSLWGTARPGYSSVLGSHIRASEMTTLPAPRDAEYLARNLALPVPYVAPSLAWVDGWPRYEQDAYVGKWATLKTPILVANGLFDMQTPISIARDAKVEHPTGGHVILFDTPCGYKIMRQFLLEPTAKIDTACLADEANPGFDLEPAHAKYWFGVEDAWEGVL